MANELSTILRDVVARAAKTPPKLNDDLSKARKRFSDCSKVRAVVCDLSGSMLDLIGHSNTRKIDHLKIALMDLISNDPNTVIIGFGSWAKTFAKVEDLPTDYELYSNSTNLAAGLEEAAKLKPFQTIIISDGVPDSEKMATEAVDELTGRVDCIYCGPDGHPAVAFLQSLARKGCGVQMTFDGYGKELGLVVRGLLA